MEGARAGISNTRSSNQVEANPTHQTIVTLVNLRRAHPSFPIRPYLPQLVEGLEDSDGTVRDCARNSVIEIFTAPGVTDAARADLKKEMTKKNVRKTIVEAVIGKLMAAGSNTDVGSPPSTTATNDSGFTKPPTLSTTLSTASSSTSVTARTVASASPATTEPPASQALSDVPTVFVSDSTFLCHQETQIFALGGISTRPRAGVCKHAPAFRGQRDRTQLATPRQGYFEDPWDAQGRCPHPFPRRFLAWTSQRNDGGLHKNCEPPQYILRRYSYVHVSSLHYGRLWQPIHVRSIRN